MREGEEGRLMDDYELSAMRSATRASREQTEVLRQLAAAIAAATEAMRQLEPLLREATKRADG